MRMFDFGRFIDDRRVVESRFISSGVGLSGSLLGRGRSSPVRAL